jgi:hypothetical protein
VSSRLRTLTADTGENPVRETTQREDAQEENMLEEGTQEDNQEENARTGAEGRRGGSVDLLRASLAAARSACAGSGQACAAAPWLRTTDW